MTENFCEAKIKMPRDSQADPNVLQTRILLVTKEGASAIDPKKNAELLAQCLIFIDREVLAELPAAISEALEIQSKKIKKST